MTGFVPTVDRVCNEVGCLKEPRVSRWGKVRDVRKVMRPAPPMTLSCDLSGQSFKIFPVARFRRHNQAPLLIPLPAKPPEHSVKPVDDLFESAIIAVAQGVGLLHRHGESSRMRAGNGPVDITTKGLPVLGHERRVRVVVLAIRRAKRGRMKRDRFHRARKVLCLESVEILGQEVRIGLEDRDARYHKVASVGVGAGLIEIQNVQEANRVREEPPSQPVEALANHLDYRRTSLNSQVGVTRL